MKNMFCCSLAIFLVVNAPLHAMGRLDMRSALLGDPALRAQAAQAGEIVQTMAAGLRANPDRIRLIPNSALMTMWNSACGLKKGGLGALSSDIEDMFIAELRRRGITDRDVMMSGMDPVERYLVGNLMRANDQLRSCMGETHDHHEPYGYSPTTLTRPEASAAPVWGSDEFRASVAPQVPYVVPVPHRPKKCCCCSVL